MVYSPYCGHCTKVHPVWVNLMDEYESDPGIIIAEVNSITDPNVSSKAFKVTSYPSFLTIIHKHRSDKRVNRTIESFRQVAESLKQIDMSIECLIYDPIVAQYPCFVLKSSSLEDACQGMREMGAQYIIESPNATSRILELHYDRNTVLTYKGKINNPLEVREFMKESELTPLGNWILPKPSSRVTGVLIYNTTAMRSQFAFHVNNVSSQYAIAGCLYSEYSKFYHYKLTPEDIPALILSSFDNKEIRIIKNIKPEQISDLENQTMIVEKTKVDGKSNVGKIAAIIITGYVIVVILVFAVIFIIKNRNSPKYE